MNERNAIPGQFVWKFSIQDWALIMVGLLTAAALFREGLAEMAMNWETEEYSHGYMIPLLAVFLLWQKKDELERLEFTGSWAGLALVVVGIFLYVLGTLSAVIDIVSYGFVVTLFGLALSFGGRRAYSHMVMPLLILVFMIPVPGFLFESMSNSLQLLSSKIGVAVIRAFDISVFLEGNVIDLGNYQMQVVEACSGLRYLFPLMALGFIAAYFFKVSFWKRLVVFLSTIPITVLMNSTRIGIIGVTVEYWGVEMAEGFLHDFEGWAIFMACTVVLVLEMWLLSRVGRDPRPLMEVFGLVLPERAPKEITRVERKPTRQFLASLAILVIAAATLELMPDREDLIPGRQMLTGFPGQIGEWKGKADKMEQIFQSKLNFDDYLMADYNTAGGDEFVNLYIGYYAVQRADKVPHSPKACIPGGGWAIRNMSRLILDDVKVSGQPLLVNRLQIEKGDYKQIVYYWFQQRGRVVANEYMVKLYLLWDSITRRRTDGALVRLTTFVEPGQDPVEADARLQKFARHISGVLPAYIPD
jgi:exosortase D (VPLPA-CTERM-specific)